MLADEKKRLLPIISNKSKKNANGAIISCIISMTVKINNLF